MTPEKEKLKTLFEKNKADLDGGFLNSICEFSEDCFNEFKSLGDNAKVADLFKYIVAAYHVGRERGETWMKNLQKEIDKLKED